MAAGSSGATDYGAESNAVLKRKPMRDDEEMDITPMIDITFLLLIYFLVASTQEQSAKVITPEALYARGVSEANSTTFSIQEGGLEMSPVFAGDTTDPDALITGTKEEQGKIIEDQVRIAVAEGNIHVVIMAENGVSYKEVARVAGAASRVEGMELHFGVLKPQ